MAGVRLGYLRIHVVAIGRDQLSPAKMVQGRVPIRDLHHHARLYPLPHLASDRRPQHLRIPFCKVCFHLDM
jgi:hypothetical protein